MKDLIKKAKDNKWIIITSFTSILFLSVAVILICTTVFKDKYISVCKTLEIKEDNYDNLKTKYDNSENKIKEQEEKIIELSKQEKQDEINNNIKTLESKVTDLTSTKESLETEITTLKEDVIKTKGEGKTYPAGHLSVGKDIPTGKYKIYGGSSNFVVYSSYGDLEVNVILGGRYGIEEYIYTFKSGDKVEASSSFKLVEVE